MGLHRSHQLENNEHVTHSSKTNQRRVAFATVTGTTVEWYDFCIYATAAGLVFAQLFFDEMAVFSQLGWRFSSVDGAHV